MMIKAEVVADSLSPQGDRLTSLLVTFPRIILAEVNTHRMLSKNTASSRAIPFNKMVETVQNNPFIPIAWQKDHKGMQGNEYIIDLGGYLKGSWLQARDLAVNQAKLLNSLDCTKQLCNRLLEPFMWTTMLITGSKEGWNNFFELRCPQYLLHTFDGEGSNIFKSKKDAIKYSDAYYNGLRVDLLTTQDWLLANKGQAEIHMMALAEAIYDSMNESTPDKLEAGEWHIPFNNKIPYEPGIPYDVDRVKISTAMAARTSYTVVGDEKEINYERMIDLHNRLIIQKPLHASPMEHCARAMSDVEYDAYRKGELSVTYTEDKSRQIPCSLIKPGWCRNFKGFIQYRHILETK